MFYLHKTASQFVMLSPSNDEARPYQIGPLDTRLRQPLPHNKASGTNLSERKQPIPVSGWMARHSTIYLKVFNPPCRPLDRMLKYSKDVANLVLDDGPRNPNAFAAYDSEPPPPPQLKSRGVIAMDITEQFTNAAQRTSSDFFCGSRADNFKSWLWASSLRTPTLLYSSPLVLWK